MKKILLILFLFLSCYIIYAKTYDDKKFYLAVGDGITAGYNDIIINYLDNLDVLKEYNNSFINKDYRIKDLIRVIKYNEEMNINNKSVSIHYLLKEADIITLSIGMNDIYYKLNNNTKDIYSYVNEMINDMEILLDSIKKYSCNKVIVLGYYNITNKNNDIFTYLNYKVKSLVETYDYDYIELANIISKEHLQSTDNYYLNEEGNQLISKLIVEKFKNS